MRNALAHGYFKVDLEIVWKTIQSNLPDLHAQITEVSATLSRNSNHEGMEPAGFERIDRLVTKEDFSFGLE